MNGYYKSRSVVTRKIHLVWMIADISHIDWIKDWMTLVIQEDSDQIMVIHVYVANIGTRHYSQVEWLGNTGLVRIFYA